jgi:hypothetical protein
LARRTYCTWTARKAGEFARCYSTFASSIVWGPRHHARLDRAAPVALIGAKVRAFLDRVRFEPDQPRSKAASVADRSNERIACGQLKMFHTQPLHETARKDTSQRTLFIFFNYLFGSLGATCAISPTAGTGFAAAHCVETAIYS